jgi:hypothetical protein
MYGHMNVKLDIIFYSAASGPVTETSLRPMK